VVYTRPLFFAGQLLTEADLQQLGDYVVAKNRLHNRYLFGDGVVCGLNVTCPPCGSGKVTVNPGYALDCCGNDIVVSCPVDLDINQMVRQLMLKIRKADCGDPCAGVTNQDLNRVGTAAGSSKSAGHGRLYCLYIDYCEQQTDPVAPYSIGSTCGQATCEPTRIQESFRFELRCPDEKACDPGAAGSYRERLGDEKITERTLMNRTFLDQYLRSLKTALAAIKERPVPALDEAFWTQAKDHGQALNQSAERFARYELKDIDEEKIQPVLEHLLDLASDAARVWLQPEVRSGELQTRLIKEIEEYLGKACDAIREEAVEHALHATLPQIQAKALLRLSRELVLDFKGEEQRKVALDRPAAKRLQFGLLAHRVVLEPGMQAGIGESLSAMRDWLEDRLEQPGGSHCALLCKVNDVSLQTPGPNGEVTSTAVNNLMGAGEVLVPAVREVLRSSLCNALNPACAPCDDTGVLLSCITVEDCKVTDICNLERKFVITGPNLRYWASPVCLVGEALAEWCCPSCQREGLEDSDEHAEFSLNRTYGHSVSEALGRVPGYMRKAMSVILESPGADRRPLDFLAPMFASAASQKTESDAATELQRQLQGALTEIRNLKREHTKLQEKVSKIAKSAPRGSAQ
jgi:hypothetical protein